jgi:hypothetical protein
MLSGHSIETRGTKKQLAYWSPLGLPIPAKTQTRKEE